MKKRFLYGVNKTVLMNGLIKVQLWTDGQFFELIKILQITSQRLASRYKKMLTEHFDYLPIDVLFMKQSYPMETSYFTRVGLEKCRWVAYMLISTGSVGLPHPPIPRNHEPDDDIILENRNRYFNDLM